MGTEHSKNKMHCNQYLNGNGPLSLDNQVKNGTIKRNSKIVNGNQPDDGRMSIIHLIRSVEGYPDCDTMQINFEFEDGIQTAIRAKGSLYSLVCHFYYDTMTYHHCDSVSFFPLKEKHPNPGQKYYGLKTVAFVPLNHEGMKVYRLLEVAFEHKLLFTVKTTSTGEEQVTFSDIPLKTKESGGHDSFSYPDPMYLKTVMEILNLKGIK
ncbi:hypothetical protein QTP86_022252 [Hemibagrus guttatus]|nr:hypothetical protein QTP86_022252 [Hemibagrus guttatus]